MIIYLIAIVLQSNDNLHSIKDTYVGYIFLHTKILFIDKETCFNKKNHVNDNNVANTNDNRQWLKKHIKNYETNSKYWRL